ncbi:MAG: hypothetical protein Q8K98_08815 [Bacteroidota bacterium]|nr:hypothetical protein [Bacteroidota bacterium]
MKTITPKIAVITLGCAKNVVDSEELLRQIVSSDYNIVSNPDDAKCC